MLTVVIPAYDEDQMIKKTSETISTLLENEKIDYEILYVDDGSKDNTWKEIKLSSENNERIRGISFS